MTDDLVGLSQDEFATFLASYGGDERFELVGGQVQLMVGGTQRHDLTAMALLRAVEPTLEGTNCTAFIHNRMLRTSASDAFFPDLLIHCGKAAGDLYETDARVVVEVLSPSNGPMDRTRRLYAYQSLRSIEVVLFVDTDSRTVTVHERNAEGAWCERAVSADGTLRTTGLEIDMASVWHWVNSKLT